jgi:hypothetical protein
VHEKETTEERHGEQDSNSDKSYEVVNPPLNASTPSPDLCLEDAPTPPNDLPHKKMIPTKPMHNDEPLRIGVNKKSKKTHLFRHDNVGIGCGHIYNDVTFYTISCKEDYWSETGLKECLNCFKQASLPGGWLLATPDAEAAVVGGTVVSDSDSISLTDEENDTASEDEATDL